MADLETSFEAAAYRVLDVALPAACRRPATVWDVPVLLLQDFVCFKAFLSRLIGFGIVFFAGLIKFPQILTIYSAKSVEGLSITTFLVETFGYTYNLAAHIQQDYPVSTYGDFLVLILQNYFIIYLCFAYTQRPLRGLAVIATYVVGLVTLCSPLVPVEFVQAMTLANVPVVIVGRVPQIYANYKNGSTGKLSAITSWGIFLGAAARIFTTMQDVDSFNILLGYLVSATLNGTIAFQVVYYRIAKKMPSEKKDK